MQQQALPRALSAFKQKNVQISTKQCAPVVYMINLRNKVRLKLLWYYFINLIFGSFKLVLLNITKYYDLFNL